MRYTLSLCIPTFQGKTKLSYVLPQILSVVDPERVEVCVSDNGSDDGTADFVESLMGAHANLKLHRFDENKGFATNYCAALHMGTGRYHMLMGDDDIPYFPNFNILLDCIESGWNYDVCLLKPYGFRKQYLPENDESCVLSSFDDYLSEYVVMTSWIATYLFRHDIALAYELRDGNAFPHLEWLFENFKRLHVYYHAVPTMMESAISSCSYNKNLMNFYFADLVKLIIPYEKSIQPDVLDRYLSKVKGSILSFKSMLGYRARGCLSRDGIKHNKIWINYYPLRLKVELWVLLCIPSCILAGLYRQYRKEKLNKHVIS